MNDKQKLALSEAREYLNDIVSSTSKVTDKIWQLLLFYIAIDIYLIQFFLTGSQNILIILLSIFCIPMSAMGLSQIIPFMFPKERRITGIEPNRFNEVINDDEDSVFSDILNTYQVIINDATNTLDKINRAYKNSFYFIISIVVGSILLLLCSFL